MVNCPNPLVVALGNLGCACLCSNCAISAKYKSAFGMRNVNTTSVTKTFFYFNYNFIDTIERSVAILQPTFFMPMLFFLLYTQISFAKFVSREEKTKIYVQHTNKRSACRQ